MKAKKIELSETLDHLTLCIVCRVDRHRLLDHSKLYFYGRLTCYWEMKGYKWGAHTSLSYDNYDCD